MHRRYNINIIDNKILLVEVLRAHLNYDRQRLNENPNIKLKHNSINRREVSIKQIERSELGTYYVDELYDGIVKDSVLRLKNEKQTKILSVSSREKVMNVIYAGLNWAVSMKMIGSNPLTDIGKKDITSDLSGQSIRESNAKDMQIEYFNEAEVNKLISTVNNTEKGNNHKYEGRELLLFLLHTGLRIGEALALRWSDYEDKYKMLNVTKSRTVVFDENAADSERYKMREGTTKSRAPSRSQGHGRPWFSERLPPDLLQREADPQKDQPLFIVCIRFPNITRQPPVQRSQRGASSGHHQEQAGNQRIP